MHWTSSICKRYSTFDSMLSLEMPITTARLTRSTFLYPQVLTSFIVWPHSLVGQVQTNYSESCWTSVTALHLAKEYNQQYDLFERVPVKSYPSQLVLCQLVPKSSRTQYQLVPKSRRTHAISYPSQLVPSTISYPNH